MHVPQSLPAVWPCAALLAGVLAAPALSVHPAAVLALCVLAALAARCCGASKPGTASLAVCAALFCLGVWLDDADRARAAARVAGGLDGGRALETEVEGVVAGAPDTDPEGQLWLRVRVSPGSSAASGLWLGVRVGAAAPGTESAAASAALAGLGAGDRIRLWCRLTRPQGYWNPGAPDPAQSLRAAGLDALASVKNPRLVEVLARGPAGPARAAGALKRLARSRLDAMLGPAGDARALAGAMLLGDRRALAPATLGRLRDAGLIHLVAISGLHVGWLTLALVTVLRRGRLGLPLIAILAVVFLALFVQLVGARPSVLRAALAAAVVLGARCLGRDGAPLNSLALIAAALVVAAPGTLRDVGFQLSFAATAGILHRPPRPAAAPPGGTGGAAGMGLSLRAYLATAPLVAWHLGRLAPVGLLANGLGIPLAALLLLCGYGAIGLHGVPVLGPVSAQAATLATRGLLELADLCAAVPGGAFAVGRPPAWLVAAHYGLLASFSRRPPTDGAPWAGAQRGARVAALALAVVLVHLGPLPWAGGATEVSVIDVGQGQAVAVRTPGGGAILIDAGGAYAGVADPGERVVVPYLLRLGVRRLDALIVSHEHLDHVGGAVAVVRDLELGQLWIGPRSLRHPGMRSLIAAARASGTAIVLAERGRVLNPGGLRVEILSPDRRTAAPNGNDDSVAVRLGRAPARLLVPGDLEAAGESALLGGGADIRAEALVLSHHGSRSGTGPPFLAGVAPRLAVASAGRNNRFGHPAPEVLRRLADRRVVVWRTDLHGRVRLLQDGTGTWRVDAWRPGTALSRR